MSKKCSAFIYSYIQNGNEINYLFCCHIADKGGNLQPTVMSPVQIKALGGVEINTSLLRCVCGHEHEIKDNGSSIDHLK